MTQYYNKYKLNIFTVKLFLFYIATVFSIFFLFFSILIFNTSFFLYDLESKVKYIIFQYFYI